MTKNKVRPNIWIWLPDYCQMALFCFVLFCFVFIWLPILSMEVLHIQKTKNKNKTKQKQQQQQQNKISPLSIWEWWMPLELQVSALESREQSACNMCLIRRLLILFYCCFFFLFFFLFFCFCFVCFCFCFVFVFVFVLFCFVSFFRIKWQFFMSSIKQKHGYYIKQFNMISDKVITCVRM